MGIFQQLFGRAVVIRRQLHFPMIRVNQQKPTQYQLKSNHFLQRGIN